MNEALIEGSPLFKLGRKEGVLRVITRSDLQGRMNDAAASDRAAFVERVAPELQDLAALEDPRQLLRRRIALRNLTLSHFFRYSYAPDESETPDLQRSDPLKRSLVFGNELWRAYQRLSGAMHDHIKELENRGKPTEVFVPPISALILKKATAPRDIPEITFEFRKKLTPVREAFCEYERAVRDQDVSLEESRSRL
jgi:hypothetical protein